MDVMNDKEDEIKRWRILKIHVFGFFEDKQMKKEKKKNNRLIKWN